MDLFDWRKIAMNFDATKDLALPGDHAQTLDFCVHHWIQVAKEAIENRGRFHVALSGGSTPNAIYKKLSQPPFREQIDWTKVYLFWGDERSVPIDHPENNYSNSMQAGFNLLPIPSSQIFRMQAEEHIQEQAFLYESLLLQNVPNGQLDLVMLGMGEDGHTASLFPNTHALTVEDRWIIANYVPQKETWRMTFTYRTIQQARHIAIYVIGAQKAAIIKKIFAKESKEFWPIQKVGSKQHKALWILDHSASQLIINH